MTNEFCRNVLELCGSPLDVPVFSHENHGLRFYRFSLQVPRLSGQADTLPVIIAEPLVAQILPQIPIRIRGQLRSFNNKSGEGNRLILTAPASITISAAAA